MIRRAVPQDAEAIHALMEAAFTPFRAQYTDGCFDATVLDPERIRRRMAEGPVFIAAEAAQGTVSLVDDGDRVYVRGMGVHPDARRQGIGRALLQAAEEHAKAQGARAMWLSTTPFLGGSIALYRSFGFVDAPGPEDLFGTPLRSFEKVL